MNLVDSSGWIHYFMNGSLAKSYAEYLSKTKELVTPTVVLYEVYKKLKSELSEEGALMAAAQMEKTVLAPLSESIAYHAADLALEHKLAMADAIVYATADVYKAKLITSDSDFKRLPQVTYINTEEK